MPPKSREVLKSETRKMVFDVFSFMKCESRTVRDAIRRTVQATTISESTVKRIVRESKLSEFITPGKKKNRKRQVTNIDSFVVKKCIQNFHITNKELPTVEKLRQKLQEDISFEGSGRSVSRMIKELGFRWKKTENKRHLLIEKSKLRCQRIEYLENIMKYRQQGRPIIHSGELYIDSYYTYSKTPTDESRKEFKMPFPKDQRIVIVHAGSEAGFVSNALLLFTTYKKPGDCRDNMNFENYQRWLHDQLIPNLPPNSVLVVGNASHHNKQYNPAPKSTAKKAALQKWLSERGIEYDQKMHNPQLYNLVKLNKESYKKFIIDDILTEHGHTVLRIPTHHAELNPIEMVWAAIKGDINSKNINDVIQLVKDKIGIMGASEWAKFYDKVKEIELEYVNSDRVVDLAIEQFSVNDDDDDSSSDSDDDSDDDILVPKTSGSTKLKFENGHDYC